MPKSRKRAIIEEVAEKMGWNVSFSVQNTMRFNEKTQNFDKKTIERYVEFECESPAGEDVVVTEYYSRFDDIPAALYERYDDFDVEDHVKMWLEAKERGTKGIPDVRTLVEDAEWQEQAILDLSFALRDALGRRIA